MDFPTDWVIDNIEDYTAAGPSYQGEVTVELLAQLRNTGHILDGFRFTLDGASPLEAVIDVHSIIPADLYRGVETGSAVLGAGYRHSTQHDYLGLDERHRLDSQQGLQHHGQERRQCHRRPLPAQHHRSPGRQADQWVDQMGGGHRRRRLPEASVASPPASRLRPERKSDLQKVITPPTLARACQRGQLARPLNKRFRGKRMERA